MRMLSDHAITADFLRVSAGITHNPLTAQQTCGDIANVAQSDGVGERVPSLIRRGLLTQVTCGDGNFNGWGDGWHAGILAAGGAIPRTLLRWLLRAALNHQVCRRHVVPPPRSC